MLPIPASHVVCSPVDSGAVLLSTEDEIYFGLNEVGSRIWALLPPRCQSLDELCEALGKEYPDVPPSQFREDVLELIELLRENRLVADSEEGP